MLLFYFYAIIKVFFRISEEIKTDSHTFVSGVYLFMGVSEILQEGE